MNHKQTTSKSEWYSQSLIMKSQKKLLQECKKVIKQLQDQLSHALHINQQKDKIIKLLTQEKQFYYQESKKSDQKIYLKIKDQIQWNNSLINGLKQHNKQLKQKNQILTQANEELWEHLKQKDQIIIILQSKIKKIQQQKAMLEKQWGTTLKCVKNKIFQIYKKQPAQKDITKRSFSKVQKQQIAKKSSIQQKQSQKPEQKVYQVLKQLDQKLFSYEFQDIIKNKQVQRIEQDNESNKQNISINLKSFQGNQSLFKQKINTKINKQRKLPILQLSQLNLNQDERYF